MKHPGTASSSPGTGQHSEVEGSLPREFFRFYRGLLGQIETALPGQQTKVLLLSSSVEGEGTTEIGVGLALSLALGMERRTAMVDCNLYHPEIHVRFGTHETGLTDYLAGQVDLERALVNTVVPNLHVMPFGRVETSLSGFDKDQLRDLVSSLRKSFEYVLIDSAPIGAHPEFAALCDQVDGVILVIKHGTTRREVVRRSRGIIERAGGKVIGAVLNRRRFPIPEFLYRKL
jgi:capsular exopolysaccharide synthesis family protein